MTQPLPFGVDYQPPRWRQTAHEYAGEVLRRAILSGTLPAGTRLVQADIAAKLDLSTTPVREALRQLAADGLVVFDAHVGAIVRRRDKSELIEVYEILAALSPLAMRRAGRHISGQELAKAWELYERMNSAADSSVWAKLNVEFHAIVEGAAKAPTVASMLNNMHNAAAIHVIRALETDPDRMASANEEHAEVLRALASRDGERASQIMAQHVSTTLDLLLTTFDAEG